MAANISTKGSGRLAFPDLVIITTQYSIGAITRYDTSLI